NLAGRLVSLADRNGFGIRHAMNEKPRVTELGENFLRSLRKILLAFEMEHVGNPFLVKLTCPGRTRRLVPETAIISIPPSTVVLKEPELLRRAAQYRIRGW